MGEKDAMSAIKALAVVDEYQVEADTAIQGIMCCTCLQPEMES